MEAWQALFLGLVEGVTEYLPVSSTGHLILAQRALGLENDAASRAYAIGIQSGAILAVLGLYLERVRQIARGCLGRDDAGVRLAVRLCVAFVPAAALGLALDEFIDSVLFGLWPVTAAWFLGGVLILALRPLRAPHPVGRSLDELGLSHALWIGLAQCLALAPGTSRSLVTIAAGLLVGLSSAAAVEFSLLLGLLTLSAATAHAAASAGREVLASYGAWNVALGFAASFASAWLAVKGLVAWLSGHGLFAFGLYRMGLAVLVAGLLAAGVIAPR